MNQLTLQEMKVLSAKEYFLIKKKTIDRYVEGEHKWYGNVDELYVPCMNDSPSPWYLNTTPGLK